MLLQFRGLYRTSSADRREAEVYIDNGSFGDLVRESVYRAKRYQPEFEALPSLDEYEMTIINVNCAVGSPHESSSSVAA